MTVGEYDDADKDGKCCNDFHGGWRDIVEDIIEDETREGERELKNSGDSSWYIFETSEVES